MSFLLRNFRYTETNTTYITFNWDNLPNLHETVQMNSLKYKTESL